MFTCSNLRFHGVGLFSIIRKKGLLKKNSKLKVVPKKFARRAPGFLKLILYGSSVCMFVCVCVCVCVCPRQRLLITSGVIWRDMNLIGLVKQALQLLYGNYSCYR